MIDWFLMYTAAPWTWSPCSNRKESHSTAAIYYNMLRHVRISNWSGTSSQLEKIPMIQSTTPIALGIHYMLLGARYAFGVSWFITIMALLAGGADRTRTDQNGRTAAEQESC